MRKNLPVNSREVTFGSEEKLISSTDLKGTIKHCNDAFARVSGYSREELIGQPHNLIRHPDMPQLAFQIMWDYIQAGKPWMGIVKNRCKDGGFYWVNAYVTPLTKNGKVVGYESVRTKPDERDVKRAESLYKKLEKYNGLSQNQQPAPPKMASDYGFLEIFSAIVGVLSIPAFLFSGAVPGLIALLVSVTLFASATFAKINTLKKIFHDNTVGAFINPLAIKTYSPHKGFLGMLEQTLKSEKSHLDTVLTRIQDAAETVLQKSIEVEKHSDINNEKLDNQQSETEMVASAMNEMTATINEVSENVSDTAKSSEKSSELAHKGESISEETLNMIVQLKTTVEHIGNTVKELSEQSGSIIEAAKIIDKIAEQTNLLALNAAIEAARAGEQGRGFAVVADEVRELALRTQKSTQEIHTIISRLSSSSSEAVEAVEVGDAKAEEGLGKMRDLESSLKGITSAMRSIADMTDQMASAVEEQSQVSEDINEQVVRIASLASECLDSGNQTKHSVYELKEIANSLGETVQGFRRV